MQRRAASSIIKSVLSRGPAPAHARVDDGASSTGHAFGVRERFAFLEADAVSYVLVLLLSSRALAACGGALLRAAAAPAVVMLGLALHSARPVLHGALLRGPSDFVGYLCLPGKAEDALARLARRPACAELAL